LLPIGISFYTFQTLSYSIDVYKREIPAERHLGKYALFVSFFPQLVAGPIERTKRLLPQFSKVVHFNAARIKKGIMMMAWGFFLKLVVADRLGVYVDDVFYKASDYRGLPLVLGSYFFAFQIYYDFSAYCAIAIGAAKVLGYDLMQNFNRPLFFSSFRDLWRRWHISLMEWFRDYLYIPLLKNLKFSKVSAVLVVFFFNGLWHGASWTFIVWGVLCGVLLIAETVTIDLRRSLLRSVGLNHNMKVIKFLNWLTIFSLLVITLVFFRSKSIGQAGIYLNNMFSFSSSEVDVYHDKFELGLSLFLVVVVQTIHFYKGNDRIYELIWNRPRWLRWIFYLLFILVMVLFSVNRQNNFIYFQF
jgi:D-alanyl-lipoteichoic acid acyltransferase DltB (MBOAT superfamily)